jgi:Uma2 family endonuclease
MENVLEEPAISYNRYYTEEEYLNLNWQNGERFEYWNGDLVAMAGGSINHSKIAVNLITSIAPLTRKNGCSTFGADTPLRINQGLIFFLPDVMVTCNENDKHADKFLTSPTLIIEILSNSTELYDRSRKWEQYRKIKSLRYYLLVSQNDYKVEMFYRPNEMTLFTFQSFDGPEAIIHFLEWNFSISLKNIYEGIIFDQAHNETIEQ